ncbi:MAG: ribonuclease HII [Rickettsiales bacterium]|nr:ribonuclease HII [Rickettsiales bacterium]OUW04481.1 MAG: ribonuclease HII [Betaproteobacteria bacterium TMED156]
MYPKKKLIIGIDEVGRGSLAGPVCSVASSLICSDFKKIQVETLSYVKDSKLLSANKRQGIYKELINQKIIFGVGWASIEEISKYNILRATILSMTRAFKKFTDNLSTNGMKFLVKIDGIHSPKNVKGPWDNWTLETETVKNGDSLVKEISIASILAKVTRDTHMIQLDKKYPLYKFKKNMGYGTEEHIKILKKFGPCSCHRKTFSPINKL